MQNKKYDLEDKTLKFVKECIDLCRLLIRDTINIELVSQLIRASSPVGANYREAFNTTPYPHLVTLSQIFREILYRPSVFGGWLL